MKIGTVNGRNVIYSEVNHTARVANTSILLVGVKSIEEAVQRCKINLKGFEEA